MCRSKEQGGRRCPAGKRSRKKSVEASVLTTDAPHLPPANISIPNMPRMTELLSITPDEWYARPWKERKELVTRVFHEAVARTGTNVEFAGWNRSKRTLGQTRWQMNRFTGEVSRPTIQLSDEANRHTTPASLANTIAHELAHARVGHGHGHGKKWADEFAAVNDELGLDIEVSVVHEDDAVEAEQRMKLLAEKAAKPPVWLGLCPQGHRFGAGRKMTRSYSCVKCLRSGHSRAEALITYTRNTNKETV